LSLIGYLESTFYRWVQPDSGEGAGFIQRRQALRASPQGIMSNRYASNIAAMITTAASDSSVQKGILGTDHPLSAL